MRRSLLPWAHPWKVSLRSSCQGFDSFTQPGLVEKSVQTERVGESIPIPTEILNPKKGATPTGAFQTGSASPATSPVISASDPFVALS